MDRGAFKFVLFSRDPVVSQFLFLFFEKLHADWAPKTLFAWEIQYNQTGVEWSFQLLDYEKYPTVLNFCYGI